MQKSNFVGLRLDDKLHSEIQKVANDLGLSVSDVTRFALREFLGRDKPTARIFLSQPPKRASGERGR